MITRLLIWADVSPTARHSLLKLWAKQDYFQRIVPCLEGFDLCWGQPALGKSFQFSYLWPLLRVLASSCHHIFPLRPTGFAT